MGLLNRFDLSSDFTQFFLAAVLLILLFTVLLTWVSPKSRDVRKRRGRLDDRAVNTDGELID